MTTPDIKLFIVCHKKTPVLKTDIFTPIQVGRAIAKERLDMIGDDTGENISAKNKSWCEITATYWAWKNSRADWKGIAHYRRIFHFRGWNINLQGKNRQGMTTPFRFSQITPEVRDAYGWHDDVIRAACADCDAIVLRPDFLPAGRTLYQSHATDFYEEDIKTTMEVIRARSPHMTPYMDRVLYRSYGSFKCMILAKAEIFDAYAAWLADILAEVERRIDISLYNDHEKRVFGYLAEMITPIYIEYLYAQGKKIKETYFVYGDFDAPRKPANPLWHTTRTVKTTYVRVLGLRVYQRHEKRGRVEYRVLGMYIGYRQRHKGYDQYHICGLSWRQPTNT